jgi:prolyl oligopeptidase
MEVTAYHEAVPGHHLQGSLAIEVPGRPAFRRSCSFSALDEGWGLYSEGLAAEVGLYSDPYAEFGRLVLDALRCARLVVDTGLHHRRWSRERAIEYLEANTALPRIEIEIEVDRYIAWPGQALAYKVGELKIRELEFVPSVVEKEDRFPWYCHTASRSVPVGPPWPIVSRAE